MPAVPSLGYPEGIPAAAPADQNGKLDDIKPVLSAKCGGKAKKKSKHGGGAHHR